LSPSDLLWGILWAPDSQLRRDFSSFWGETRRVSGRAAYILLAVTTLIKASHWGLGIFSSFLDAFEICHFILRTPFARQGGGEKSGTTQGNTIHAPGLLLTISINISHPTDRE
ncbi:unnamed protein product, partial [Ectocarpus sp. 12 AP-2014]